MAASVFYYRATSIPRILQYAVRRKTSVSRRNSTSPTPALCSTRRNIDRNHASVRGCHRTTAYDVCHYISSNGYSLGAQLTSRRSTPSSNAGIWEKVGASPHFHATMTLRFFLSESACDTRRPLIDASLVQPGSEFFHLMFSTPTSNMQLLNRYDSVDGRCAHAGRPGRGGTDQSR